mmetsp:Transcript_15881/g.36492  ORF Transcript_15881/g.36492 Transcript_15881/m.36492 type:complete len:88 (-) Transcript_15881:96-359(-)
MYSTRVLFVTVKKNRKLDVVVAVAVAGMRSDEKTPRIAVHACFGCNQRCSFLGCWQCLLHGDCVGGTISKASEWAATAHTPHGPALL